GVIDHQDMWLYGAFLHRLGPLWAVVKHPEPSRTRKGQPVANYVIWGKWQRAVRLGLFTPKLRHVRAVNYAVFAQLPSRASPRYPNARLVFFTLFATAPSFRPGSRWRSPPASGRRYRVRSDR